MINKSVVHESLTSPTTLTLLRSISMSIYTSRRSHTKYRKIYEQHYGEIPREENGRTYDIHHIDGNHLNNDPENLKAVSLQEHYDIHHNMKDWGACIAIKMRMDSDPNLISELNKKRIEDGTHNFLGGHLQRKRLEEGTHHFIGGEIARQGNQKRLTNGTHHLLGSSVNNKMLAEGKHPSQMKLQCPHCDKVVDSPNYVRWHGDFCKQKISDS